MIGGVVRVALRTFWSPLYILWLRLRVAVWGASALEQAVALCPPWLTVEILKAYGVPVGIGVDFHGRLTLHGTYDMRGKLRVGQFCHIGPGVTLDLTAPILLEDRCTISMNVQIITHQDVGYSPLAAHAFPTSVGSVTVASGAYIGAGAILLKGVQIGPCAVVSAGALVTRDVPPYTVVAGVPAQVIRQIKESELMGQDRYASTRKAWENIWDKASVEQEVQTESYTRAQATMQRYLPYLPKDDLILEAGSGLSAVLIILRRMGYRVTGLDYAENALRVSRQYDPALVLATGDVHALPYADESFGAYLSFGVLEHFEAGMTKPLAEAFRVLKPGGILVLTIPYPNVVNRLVAWRRVSRGESILNDDSFYESTYTRSFLQSNVASARFEILRTLPTSHSYTLWGLGGVFRAPGYYQTSALAEGMGKALKIVLPWAFNFTTLIIARKP